MGKGEICGQVNLAHIGLNQGHRTQDFSEHFIKECGL